MKLLPPALQAQKAYTFFKGREIFQNPRTGERWTGDKCIRQGMWAPALRKVGVRYRKPYQALKTEAERLGIPYQTYIGSVLHRFAQGELIDRKTVDLLKQLKVS